MGRYDKVDVVCCRIIFGLIVSFIIAYVYGFITGDIYTEGQTGTIAVFTIMLAVVFLYACMEFFVWYFRKNGLSSLKRKLRIFFYLMIGDVDKLNARIDEEG